MVLVLTSSQLWDFPDLKMKMGNFVVTQMWNITEKQCVFFVISVEIKLLYHNDISV